MMKDIILLNEQEQEMINEIVALKQEKNAVILAHSLLESLVFAKRAAYGKSAW